MLFGRNPRYVVRQQPIVAAVPARLPAGVYTNLPAVCGKHGMPVAMQFARWGITNTGFPSAIYRCCIPGCRTEATFVRDHATGQPRVLHSR